MVEIWVELGQKVRTVIQLNALGADGRDLGRTWSEGAYSDPAPGCVLGTKQLQWQHPTSKAAVAQFYRLFVVVFLILAGTYSASR